MFKPGDKVKCIKPSGNKNAIIKNKIYIVEKVYKSMLNDLMLKLKDNPVEGWYATRFVLANTVRRNLPEWW